MTSKEKIQEMLALAEERVAILKVMLAQAEKEESEKEASNNALNAIFDGIKYRADEEKPFPFVAPMKCYPNMFYLVGNKKFVCISPKPVIVDNDNFNSKMEEW